MLVWSCSYVRWWPSMAVAEGGCVTLAGRQDLDAVAEADPLHLVTDWQHGRAALQSTRSTVRTAVVPVQVFELGSRCVARAEDMVSAVVRHERHLAPLPGLWWPDLPCGSSALPEVVVRPGHLRAWQRALLWLWSRYRRRAARVGDMCTDLHPVVEGALQQGVLVLEPLHPGPVDTHVRWGGLPGGPLAR